MPITDSLVAHWKMDEASGTRADSHGSNDLTEGNSPGSVAGKIGNAVEFQTDNVDYLIRADNAALSTGDIDFSFACWVNLTDGLNYFMAFAKATEPISGPELFEYRLYYDYVAGRFKFTVGSGAAYAEATASTFGGPSAGTWYFLYCYHDAAANQLGISVNDGAVDTTSYSGGGQDTAGSFYAGAQYGFVYRGKLDSLSMWKRVLTGGEVTSLYNGGSGLDYPFTVGTVSGRPLVNAGLVNRGLVNAGLVN